MKIVFRGASKLYIMKKENYAFELYSIIPLGILEYYAEQNNLSKIDLCRQVSNDNIEWWKRVFDEDLASNTEDIIHDFIRLTYKDPNFSTRI